MDCVLIQHGRAHEIWRNTTKASLKKRYTAALLNDVVEIASDPPVQVGDVWDGTAFSAPPPPAQNPLRSTRLLIDRFTDTEWDNLKAIVAAKSAAVKKEFDAWQAGPTTDTSSPRFTTLANELALELWPDAIVREQRMAELVA